jgi:predicted DNA-binding mobile mystery protein A
MPRVELEQKLGRLRGAQAAALQPAGGWLREVRVSVGLSQEAIAQGLRVKRQSYAQFETAEVSGSISLTSLRRAAEAMDCELVYFIVPREAIARTYSELAQIHDPQPKKPRERKSRRAPEDRSDRAAVAPAFSDPVDSTAYLKFTEGISP